MERIAGLDDGAYAFFDFQARKFPWLLEGMQPAYSMSGYVGAAVLIVVVTLIYLLQRKYLGAFVCLLAFGAAIGSIEAMRLLVPRAWPQGAAVWLGDDAPPGSYPAPGVFLFMLGVLFVSNAVWDSLSRWKCVGFVVLAVVLMIWICLAPLVMGIHFVTDVIGALAGAVIIATIAQRIMALAPAAPPAAP